jgi:transaldolase
VYSFVQAVAAAQAGVSVIQPNIGRIEDWYNQHPGFIRDPMGPRQDVGGLFKSDINPGVQLVQRMYNYVKKYHPKSVVMASGIRRKEDALALAGIDYLVLSGRVVEQLDRTPTLQGYNDGLHSTEEDDEGVPRLLSPETAQQATFRNDETQEMTQQLFEDGLKMAGLQLLDQSIKGLVGNVNGIEPYFRDLAIDAQ